MARLIPFVLLVTLLTGCQDPHKVMPVSGRVTLNSKPLPDATVTFLPITKPGSSPGVTSTGKTDSDGQFVLQTSNGTSGAIIGEHEVQISTLRMEYNEDDYGSKVLAPEILPVRFNAKSELTFRVPDEGTSEANFELTTGR